MASTVGEYLADFLAKYCNPTIFVISGAGNLRMLEPIARHPDLSYICPHHEQAGVMAANTLTRLSDKLGVMMVTAGPGAVNSITGIASAWLDSIPVLILSGQEKKEHLRPENKIRCKGVQGLDMLEVTRSITKYGVRLTDPMKIRYELEKAFYIAHAGKPGPVWFEIPLDVQSAPIREDELEGFTPPPEKEWEYTNEIAKLREMIQEAERPMIWGGHGIRLAKKVDAFRELVDELKIPVLLTWAAADFLDHDNPYYVGRAGVYGNRGANFALQNCDLLICLGTRIAIPQRGYDDNTWARAAKKVVVDIDQDELDKFKTEIHLPICGDVGPLVEQLLIDVRARPVTYKKGDWQERCQDWKKNYPPSLPEDKNTPDGEVNSYYFVDQLSDILTSKDIVITDMGTALLAIHSTLRIKLGQRLATSTGLGEMGYGLPAAIGACYGIDKKRTIFIGTEGSLMMNLQELQTVIAHKLPIKIFIMNNNSYLMIKHSEKNLFKEYFASTPETGVTFPDLKKVFTAFGYPCFRIDSVENMNETIEKVIATEGPVFCDVIMNEDQMLGPKLNFKVMPDGSLKSPPLEDLWPFLPKEEVQKNMLIPPVDD